MKKKKEPLLRRALLGIQSHPAANAVIVMAIYFFLDSSLLNVGQDIGLAAPAAALAAMGALFFISYVSMYLARIQPEETHDAPSWIKRRGAYAVSLFFVLAAAMGVAVWQYAWIEGRWFPNLANEYYPSQVILLMFIAPVTEELVFRYLLYDRWARGKFGAVAGAMFVCVIFVVCHPVTNMHSFVLYWVPGLLLFLMYDSFGLYGSILAHMVFNLVAL